MIKLSNIRIFDDATVFNSRSEDISIVSEKAYVRAEPSFVFIDKQIKVKWYKEEQQVAEETYPVNRSTIALFIPIPGIGTSARLTALFVCDEVLLARVSISDKRSPLTRFRVLAAAKAAERDYHLYRDYLIGLKFETLITKAAETIRESGCRLLFITGSVGKTSTKEFVSHVLADELIYSSTDSWNFPHEICAQIVLNGTWAKALVFEIAIGHHLPIQSSILIPHVFVFTHLGAVHTSLSGDIRELGNLKASIAAYMPDSGTVIINKDVPEIEACLKENLRNNPRIIRYGEATGVSIADNKIHARNVSAAYLAAKALFPQKPVDLQNCLDTFPGTPGRSELIHFGDKIFFNDSYNANPVSMNNFIGIIDKEYGSYRKCIVVGEMMDLGEAEAHQHELLLEKLLQLKADRLILVGGRFEKALKQVTTEENVGLFTIEELLDEGFIGEMTESFDFIGMKGSYLSGVIKAVPLIVEQLSTVARAEVAQPGA